MDSKFLGELNELANSGDVGAIYELGKVYFYGAGVEKDYGKARGYFETAAEKGSVGANYYLGKIYYNGNGVATNHVKAKEYFEKSSSADNVFSTYYLGKLYYWGDGVEKNHEKASAYKNSILGKPLYANQDTEIETFYSMPDFETATKDYVNQLQQKILLEYNRLYGKDN